MVSAQEIPYRSLWSDPYRFVLTEQYWGAPDSVRDADALRIPAGFYEMPAGS